MTIDIQVKSKGSIKSRAQQEARFVKREWIISRVEALLADFHRTDIGETFETAAKIQWADVLEGLPRKAINKGIIEYQRHGPRSQKTRKLMKPAPGDINHFSTPFVPKRKLNSPQPDPNPKRDRVTPGAAARLLKDFGYSPFTGATEKPIVVPGSKFRAEE